jgi:hypothetical protein
MPHLYFCCETECDAEAHVYGGRCDGCFEAEITYLRELHNPTRCDYCHERINCGIDSNALYCETVVFCGKWCEAGWLNEHKCSGEFDYDHGCYVCDDRDDPRCPSYRPQTRAYLINEIQRIESMLEVDRSAKSRACYYETLQRLYEQMAASSDGRRNSVVSPRVEEKKRCADCGLDRKDDEPVLHCDWYCNPCWLVRFR